MAPVPVEKVPYFDQPRHLMMLDDAEMALQLSELAPDVPAVTPQVAAPAPKRVPAPPMQYNDFLTELSAAAALIMDREECEALAKEMIARHELVVAA